MIVAREPLLTAGSGQPGPAPEIGLIEPVRNGARGLGLMAGGNPLASVWSLPATVAGVGRLVLWSGTLADGLFESHPRTWMASGREALDRLCAQLAARLAEAGVTACFRPHARHVLNDAPSCRRFLDDHAGEPFEVALSPGTLLEPTMLGTVEEHLDRIFEMLAARAALLFLHDIVVTDDGRCVPVPLGRGRLPREHVLGLIGRHLPEETPVVLLPHDLDGQLAWLEGEPAASRAGRS